MKTLENTTFDSAVDGGFTPVPAGTYPAHVSEVVINTFEDSGKSVYNLSFKVADEVKNLEVPKLSSDGNGGYVEDTDSDGNTVTVSAEFIAGKTFRLDKGMWLTPNPEQGKGWQNKTYVKYCQSLGVQFPETEDGKLQLAEIEDADILGHPCFIKVEEVAWENKKTGDSGKSVKAVDITAWQEGSKLSADELSSDDLPF
tara:strand:+ start:1243 stop:1839 length:597 start_codon:yes stop_codon:yes gene_type:complete